MISGTSDLDPDRIMEISAEDLPTEICQTRKKAVRFDKGIAHYILPWVN